LDVDRRRALSMLKEYPLYSGTGIQWQQYIIFWAINCSRSIYLMPQYGKWMEVANVYLPRCGLQTGGGKHRQVESSVQSKGVLK
jgi:hypothetical protein